MAHTYHILHRDIENIQLTLEPCGGKMLTFHTVKNSCRSPPHGAAEMNRTGNHEVAGSIPGLAKCVKDLVLL